jgi:hypothetical protein
MIGIESSKILQVTRWFKTDRALIAPKQGDAPNLPDLKVEVKLILKHVK